VNAPGPKEEHSAGSDEKTVFRQTGELIGTIGAHIALGTAKVIDFVSDEATVVKKVIKKKLAKKTVQKKKPVKKVLPTAANKPVKKTARKKSTKKEERNLSGTPERPQNNPLPIGLKNSTPHY
jgi:hypothetical protein